MNRRFPFPKRYWIYLIIILICSILLFGNIYRTNSWTGDKPFSEFTQQDWQLLVIFLIEEVIITGIMFTFTILASRIVKERNTKIAVQWKKDKYLGIKPGDYDYVWFDFENSERALILKHKNQYKLYIDGYDEHTRSWERLDNVSVHDSLEAIKKVLFYECDFYCEENAELDKHGDEIYVEENKINISSIQNITQEEISFFDAHGDLSKIQFSDVYKKWCQKYRVKKSNPKYVCDKTNVEGERRIIFYTNPRISVSASNEQENLWFEMLNNMKLLGYFAFDRD